MKDGWFNNEYFALYESQEEATSATLRYELSEYLAGFFVVGLKFWDDFILCDTEGRYYTVPTVPLTREDLRVYAFPSESLTLRPDPKLAGKIKWYVQPLVFGGSASATDNLAWISHAQHFEAVVYWNKLFRDLKGKTPNSESSVSQRPTQDSG
jgi:hypothetical protein